MQAVEAARAHKRSFMSAEKTGPFGGPSPQEAAQKSAQRRRLAKELEQSDTQQRYISAPRGGCGETNCGEFEARNRG
jgi:hypothetical protein